MLADVTTIDEDIGNAVGSLKTNEEPMLTPTFGHEECFGVVADAAFVVLFSALRVDGIPRVGQVYPLPAAFLHLMRESKPPVVIKRYRASLCLQRKYYGQQCEEYRGSPPYFPFF